MQISGITYAGITRITMLRAGVEKNLLGRQGTRKKQLTFWNMQ